MPRKDGALQNEKNQTLNFCTRATIVFNIPGKQCPPPASEFETKEDDTMTGKRKREITRKNEKNTVPRLSREILSNILPEFVDHARVILQGALKGEMTEPHVIDTVTRIFVDYRHYLDDMKKSIPREDRCEELDYFPRNCTKLMDALRKIRRNDVIVETDIKFLLRWLKEVEDDQLF
ncbi:MAG: hypothetical protein ACFFCS_12350 [Candidatus Hodarchaeota archaeon]